jgi:N-methylhydantoinase A/oxoprolinase/acetone carboxylase beta subunit
VPTAPTTAGSLIAQQERNPGAGPKQLGERPGWSSRVGPPQPPPSPSPPARAVAPRPRSPAARSTSPRAGGFVATPVYRRAGLAPGLRFTGPAVVEEAGSTLVVGPGAEARVAPSGPIVVDLPETAAS